MVKAPAGPPPAPPLNAATSAAVPKEAEISSRRTAEQQCRGKCCVLLSCLPLTRKGAVLSMKPSPTQRCCPGCTSKRQCRAVAVGTRAKGPYCPCCRHPVCCADRDAREPRVVKPSHVEVVFVEAWWWFGESWRRPEGRESSRKRTTRDEEEEKA